MVAGILENYATRGTFKGFARGPVRAGAAKFKILWHRDRLFELILDTRKKTLRFPVVLPEVPPPMYQQLKEFLDSRKSPDLPDHRRIDPKKAILRPTLKSGNVSLTMTVKTSDYEYATRKLIHLVHEIFLVFLHEGHYEYMVEVFDLDPDHL